jgi:DNA-directed RNA polymerase sigma subunit (sigma70/sigma32)
MSKKIEYGHTFDEEFTAAQLETVVQDFSHEVIEEPQTSLNQESFDEDHEAAAEPSSDSPKTKSKNNVEVSRDLRLVNAYFQEVSLEPLLTPSEEAQIAAKIKACETGAKDCKGNIEKLTGVKFDRDWANYQVETYRYLDTEVWSLSPNSSKVTTGEKRLLALLLGRYRAFTNKGVQLRNRFVKSNLRLVASLAKRYVGRGVPFLDLIQEGNMGLIKAVERFDHEKGYRFSTYACWWINQAMTRGIFNQTRTVKMPAYLLEKAGKVRHVKKVLTKENEREPFAEEIAEKAKMSVENVRRILESSGNRVVRLDTPVWAGENTTYLDFVEDSGSTGVDSLIAEISIPDNINTALLKLNIREREVVKMRFGIGYETAYTLDEIGKKFQLTRERIRQIEKKALERMRRSKSAPVLRSLMDVYN